MAHVTTATGRAQQTVLDPTCLVVVMVLVPWSPPPPRRYTPEMIDSRVEETVGAALAADDLVAAATAAVRGYGPQILGYLRATLGPAQADDAFSIFCESLWKACRGSAASRRSTSSRGGLPSAS